MNKAAKRISIAFAAWAVGSLAIYAALKAVGPFAINIFGRGVIVVSPLVPSVVIFAVLAVWAAKPGLKIYRYAVIALALFLAADVAYGELSLRAEPRGVLKNAPLPSPALSGKFAGYNLVLVSLDTLRRDHLHTYRYGRETSPNIDRFAARSVQFDNAYTQAPSTAASHGTILTGLFPGAHTFGFKKDEADYLPESAVTLAEILDASGYIAGGFTAGATLAEEFGLGQGFSEYYGEKDIVNMKAYWPKANAWLDKNKHKKFFFFLHTYDIHIPYAPPPPFARMFYPEYNGKLGDVIPNELAIQSLEGKLKLGADDLRHVVAVYDGGIRATDRYIGELVGFLEKNGLMKNTIIVILSDHGEEFNERGHVALHSLTLYDELIRVPLIMYIPGVKPRKVETLVEHADIVPTLIDLLGIKSSPDLFQGAAISGAISGGARRSGAQRVYFGERPSKGGDLQMKAVIRGKWKFVIYPSVTKTNEIIRRLFSDVIYTCRYRELYDLEKDPAEKNNLACVNVGLSRRMQNDVFATLEWNNEHKIKSNAKASVASPETIRKLKELGYIK